MKSFFVAFVFVFTGVAGYSQLIPAVIFTAPLLMSDTSLLPVHSFSVSQKDNKAFLRWKSDLQPAGTESFYAVERSFNGVDFNLVGVTKNVSGGWFEFVDDAPPKGKIFYRVKFSTAQGSYYSAMLSATPQADVSFKFYPNPVDKVLIVRSELGVELQISDAFGKALLAEKIPAGLKIIDVSSLEPGIYVITLFQKETNKLVTEKLIKK
jgi:Secretion system C-terminal sorting domain